MAKLWEDFGQIEDWGILLADAHNAVNELNRKAMLWHVQHYWLSGCRYAFNIYRYWKVSVLRGCKLVILSKEGVTQGDPMAIFYMPLEPCQLLTTSSLCRYANRQNST
eukprot:6678508-Ditylum_brightwellii.AAC.1